MPDPERRAGWWHRPNLVNRAPVWPLDRARIQGTWSTPRAQSSSSCRARRTASLR
jgi:hypothetical protein